MSVLPPLEPPASLTGQAVAALRREILTTRLLPGSSLSEASAAQMLGLGKAPVRAAHDVVARRATALG